MRLTTSRFDQRTYFHHDLISAPPSITIYLIKYLKLTQGLKMHTVAVLIADIEV